ncbi:MAG TPA: acyltransferase [Bacteroidia bacterium]|jgi:peptidoglycan/LPS O-acetylase OafA/YrhL|nr:acyltransferase [Bacteroidia bacterium]
MNKEHRIDILDSFRFIAILSVILFHYYSRWTPPGYTQNFYPYTNTGAAYFQYGLLGVNFFFIISGFVILYTLEKSASYAGFLLKRLIRLFPPILLCSVITYVCVMLMDKDHNYPIFHPSSLGFLPSLTFTNARIWNDIMPNRNIAYIDGSYWSLPIEVTFYILSGLIYFANKAKFISNWILFSSVITIILALHDNFFPDNNFLTFFLNHFLLSDYILFFTMGMLSYALFFKKPLAKWNIPVFAILILFEYHHFTLNKTQHPVTFNWSIIVILLLYGILFALFTFKPQYLGFLKIKVIQRIGVISYTIYLIHQFVGVLLINKLSQVITSSYLLPYIPILVILLVFLFAELCFRFYEKPISSYLKKALSKYIQ